MFFFSPQNINNTSAEHRNNGLMVQVGTGTLGDEGQQGIMGSIETTNDPLPTAGIGGLSPHKKSPSYHSNRSDTHMSLDKQAASAAHISSSSLNNISPAPVIPILTPRKANAAAATVPSYEDHWTYENIVLERAPGISLGFSIAGGTDNPMYGNNTAIFITKLTPGGLAEQDGRLRPNDILYKVNGVSLAEAEHSQAVQALKEAGQLVNLVIINLDFEKKNTHNFIFLIKTVKRLQPTLVEEITLEKTQKGLGFSISGGLFTEHIKNDHGIFVTKIIPGGVADMDGKLAVGDRLISVSGDIFLLCLDSILSKKNNIYCIYFFKYLNIGERF